MNHAHQTRLKLSFPAALFFVLVVLTNSTAAQTFDKAEFAARRAKLFGQIADGVAVVFAADAHVHAVKFRQAPDFYYLTGIEEPGAMLLLSGPDK